MESKNEVEGADNLVSSNKLKSPNSGSDSNTMDSGFQDGGPQNVNADRQDRNRNEAFPPNVDGSQVCGDNQNMPHDVATQNKNQDSYSRMSENGNPAYMPGYGGFPNQNRAGNMNEQHGGPGNIAAGSNDFSSPNGQFGQYGPNTGRGIYPPNSRPPNMPMRGQMGQGGVPVVGPNYSHGQQRFPMSGASIQQQGGPTPTLNQLLQNSGSNPRAQGTYGDHSSGYQRPPGDMNSAAAYSNPSVQQQGTSWMNQPRPMNPYQQPQMSANQPYRGQGSQMMSGPRQMGGGYGQQYGQPQQYHGTPQRYPVQPQGGRMQHPQSNYPPQQGGGQYGQPGYSGPGGQPGYNMLSHSQPNLGYMGPGGGGPQTQHSPPYNMQAQPKRPQSNQSVSSQENAGTNADENTSRDANGSPAMNARGTPTSVAGMPAMQGLRPPPSPAGSAGSRSNTPASVTGNASGSPMPPPRPPSNQVDGQARIQSPMAPQGYHPQQQMMPPPIGPNQMGSFGSKMQSPAGMMSPQQGAPYSQANSQYPSAGSMNRQGMPAYGGQTPLGPGGNQGIPGQQVYQNMNMSRGMPNQSYSNSNMYGPQPSAIASMNSQFGGYPQQGPVSGSPSMSSTPPSSHAMPAQAQSPKGAQAAAQAAMMAAASTVNRPQVRGPQGPPVMGAPQTAQAIPGAMPPMRTFPPSSQSSIPSSGQFGQPMMDGQMNSGFSTPSPAPPGTPHSDTGSTSQVSKQPSTPGPTPASPAASPAKSEESSVATKSEPCVASSPIASTSTTETDIKPVVSVANSEAAESSTKLTQSITAPITTETPTSSSNSAPIPIKAEQNQAPMSAPQQNGQPAMPHMPPQMRMPSNMPPNSMPNMPQGMPNAMLNAQNMRPMMPNSQSHQDMRPMMPNAHPHSDMRGPMPGHPQGDRMPYPTQQGMPPGAQPHMPNMMMPPGMPPMNDVGSAEKFRSKKTGQYDGVNKLYDMGDEPERKPFLDRLFAMMDEKGTPITAIPTITKQPLDLYKMYVSVKERGGCIEVSRHKKWRDICGCLNINTSGSAGFALRRNYVKHVLPYECRYDRGNCDPSPVIAQVEALSQKKDKKKDSNSGSSTPTPGAMGVPQPPMGPPGIPNNQGFDGFMPGPGPGPGPQPSHMPNTDMPGPPNTSIPPGTNMMMSQMNDMGQQQNMPNHMMNSNQMMGGMNRPNTSESVSVQDPFADQPSTQYNRPPGPQYQVMQSGMQSGIQSSMASPFYGNRPNMNSSGYSSGQQGPYQPGMNRMPSPQDHMAGGYNRGMNRPEQPGMAMGPEGMNQPQQAPVQGSHFPYQYNSRFGGPGGGQQQPGQPGNMSGISSQPSPMPAPPSTQEQMYPGRIPGPQGPPNRPFKQNPPGPQPYPGQRPMQSGDQMPPYQSQQTMPQSTNLYHPKPPMQSEMFGPGMSPQPRKTYSPSMERREMQSGYGSAGPPGMGHHGGPEAPMGSMYSQYGPTPTRPDVPMRHDGSQQWPMGMQPRPRPPGNQGYGNMPGSPSMQHIIYGNERPIRSSPQRDQQRPYYPPKTKKPSSANAQFQQRRDIVFPPDSVEAARPLLVKRKRLTAKDIGHVEAWKIMMALKSGLLAESTWALDTLSILLFDDHTVAYFSLTHLPGLLETLLDHLRQCLQRIFDICEDMEIAGCACTKEEGDDDVLLKPKFLEGSSGDYTMQTRQGKVVKFEEESKDSIFMQDKKDWDVYSGFESSQKTWQLGNGDMSIHVLTHFHHKNSTSFFKKAFYGKYACVQAEKKAQKACSESLDKCCGKDSNHGDNKENIENKENVEQVHAGNKEQTGGDKELSSSDKETDCQSKSSCNDSDTKCSKLLDSVRNDSEPCIKSEAGSPVQCKQEKDGAEQTNCASDTPGNNVKHEAGQESSKIPDREEIERTILNKLKRKYSGSNEPETEAYRHDNPPLFLISESQEELSKRCVCVSNILRSFSCIPGNDYEMSRNNGLMKVLSRLLVLHHRHPVRKITHRPFDQIEPTENAEDYVEDDREEWWWETLDALRENTLVILANIAGQMNLSDFPEEICLPLLDGLLHWATCPASCAQDPMPTMSLNSVLSPQRLVLETMCKLCVLEENVDLILATPPFSRIVTLLGMLVKHLSNSKEQVIREFSIVLLSSFVQGDSSAARAVALQAPSISLFLDFLETAERQAMQVAKSHGLNMLRENPEMMGTSLDMLRRAATTLKYMAMVPDNHPLFLHHEQRLLDLVTSQILDQQVAAILSSVLYHCSHDQS